jgi:hypothetical protein
MHYYNDNKILLEEYESIQESQKIDNLFSYISENYDGDDSDVISYIREIVTGADTSIKETMGKLKESFMKFFSNVMSLDEFKRLMNDSVNSDWNNYNEFDNFFARKFGVSFTNFIS